MAWVIIILVVLAVYFYSSSANTKDVLHYERSRIEHFHPLIKSITELSDYFNVTYTGHNNAYLSTKDFLKTIEIRPNENTLNVSINIKDTLGKRHNKWLSYKMPVNQLDIAETIKAEYEYFQKTIKS